MNKIKHLIICLFVFSCSESATETSFSLEAYIQNRIFETGGVIACAASDDDNNSNVLIFYYPEEGAANIRLYQTTTAEVNKDDFINYQQVIAENEPVFNGYLSRFNQQSQIEKWYIVTFELQEEIKISNPIRSKQVLKPTLWEDIVTIKQEESGMPLFEWQANIRGDNAIYFQVVSDAQDNLLSGTYTNQEHFQYYQLDNVVLNITREIPPMLILDAPYHFTLMDVSLDNWVNVVTINKNFINR